VSNNRLHLDGLKELRDALRRLPSELTSEASGIVAGAAQDAAQEIASQYPHVSGNLKRGLRVTHNTSGFGTESIVKNSSPHSHLYEYGTETRQTGLGYNRGRMPGRPTFIPAVRRKRHAMYQQLKRLLERMGLKVTGDAGR
jgi:hypothetical protein